MFKGAKLEPEHVRQMGYLPEERGLYKKMKVAEQLVYLAQLKGMKKSEAVTKTKEWFEKLEITSWYNKKVEDLSKGMQQKVQFIATVMHNPELIILDEPFSGFDPVNADLIKDEILELRNNGATIIFSTHRMESVEELCDNISLIHNSKTVINGAKNDIKNQYRDNTFIVDYQGDLPNSTSGFEILKTSKIEDVNRAEIKIQNGDKLNSLLGFLSDKVEIVSANEKIPSINDIFISTVKPTNHE
jgi:ABC-2 type transport system ATP-binding protein